LTLSNEQDRGGDKQKLAGDVDIAGSRKKTDTIAPIPGPLRT